MPTANVKINRNPDYRSTAPGRARGRWGTFRKGDPVRLRGHVGVYVGLAPLDTPAAREHARAYGRDGIVARSCADGTWWSLEICMADISPASADDIGALPDRIMAEW